MKISTIIISLFFLISCRQEKVKPPSFETIDISYGNGWTKFVSVHVDSSKTINIRVDELIKGINYYRYKLSDSMFYIINALVDSVIKNNYDSIIGQPACDGGAYCIILKSKLKTINSIKYLGEQKSNPLDNLTFKLTEFSTRIKKESTDTTFIFNSYKRIAPMPPLHEMVKFVPPVINDDNANH
jgi:hypothetical protein